MIVLDSALGDADGVFRAAVAHLGAKFAPVARTDLGTLPDDRAGAIARLDAWAASGGIANWRREFVRFHETHAPVLLTPDPALNAVLRQARRTGVDIVVASPLPRAALDLFLGQLGVGRAAAATFGEEDGGLAAARTARPTAVVAASRDELVAALS